MDKAYHVESSGQTTSSSITQILEYLLIINVGRLRLKLNQRATCQTQRTAHSLVSSPLVLRFERGRCGSLDRQLPGHTVMNQNGLWCREFDIYE